jgi:hypothetical protein
MSIPRIGLLGLRADRRGLAVLGEEFIRHIPFSRIIGLDLSSPPEHHPLDNDWSIYSPDAPLDTMRPVDMDDDYLHAFFRDLDVCLFFETDYNPHRRMPGAPTVLDIAKEEGCRTVLMAMPELHRWSQDHDRAPDVIWLPTTWETDRFDNFTLMPVPVATDRLPFQQRTNISRVLHVIGSNAMADRNGTELVIGCARANPDIEFTIRSAVNLEGPNSAGPRRHMKNWRLPNVTLEIAPIDRYWNVTEGADMLLLPRRYAGLCLPASEAAARGMVVVMLDRQPERDWLPPEALAPATIRRDIRVPGGIFATYDSPGVSATVRNIVDNPTVACSLSITNGRWAKAHSWDALLPTYMDAFSALVPQHA